MKHVLCCVFVCVCLYVCVCVFTRPEQRERERERWHIRPEGASLLESLASLSLSLSLSLSRSLSPPFLSLPGSLSSNHRGGRRTNREPTIIQQLQYGAVQFLLSNYAMIQCNIPLQIFPHKFISQAIKDTAGEIIYITVSQYNTARCRHLQRRQMCQVPLVERQPGRH